MTRARLEIPPGNLCIEPTLAFLRAFADRLGIDAKRGADLARAAGLAISLIADNNAGSGNAVAVDIVDTEGCLGVEVENHGVPIFLDGERGLALHEAAKSLDKISLENRGRSGQTLMLRMRLGEEAARRSLAGNLVSHVAVDPARAEITVRELRADETAALSQLFYYVYGYDYIHEWVYYPEKVRAMIEEGKLHGLVGALPNGRLVGHVGLLKWGDDPPVYEPCLGVVDPSLKSRGLFGTIFDRLMERLDKIPMQYLCFDFVTNHEFSQKFVARYHAVDLAIFAGCQSKETQAKLEKLGLGEDPKESDRYSLLYSILPRVKHPFGEEVRLPSSLGEMLGFLLAPLNIDWSPAPRFELLPPEGDYRTQLQPAQKAVIFDCLNPGRKAVDRILAEWRGLLRSGYQYAAVEVRADATGVGNLYDILAEAGFFVAGFIPYHCSDKLGLRFQSIGPTKLAFGEIKVHSEHAKHLLAIIAQNYERNHFL